MEHDATGAEQVAGWVRRAQAGDEEAFGELVKTYYERVYRVLYNLVGNAEDARDLAQQAWVKAWRRLGSFRGESEFYTWVYRIASNAALDHLRSRTRRPEDALPEGVEPVPTAGAEHAPSQASRPDREAERQDVHRVFEEALRSLSPEHRLALTLREVEGLSYDEIAKVMGCRKGTVMSRLFYARRAVQEQMKGLL